MLAILGGGVAVANLCSGLAQALTLEDLQIRLHARDPQRLRSIANHCQALLQTSARRGWVVTATDQLESAVKGADAIVLLIRVGGLTARAIDEQLPTAFGLPGDEGLGPGGYANALRTLPLLEKIAETLLRTAPQATVFNLMAPLGLTTRLLLDRGLKAWGVCELPTVTETELRAILPDDSAPTLHYAGLNHLGWFWPAIESPALSAAWLRNRLVDAETLQHFGAAPLKYYYRVANSAAGRRIRVVAPTARASALITVNRTTLAAFIESPGRPTASLAARPTPWFTEALEPLLAAHFENRAWQGYINLRNANLAPDLPAIAVIETRARWEAGRCVASAWPQPPPRVVDFLKRAEAAENAVYEASGEDPYAGLLLALQHFGWGADSSQHAALAAAIVAAAARPDGALA